MACLGIFEDTVDPDQPILTLRKTARVFVINPRGADRDDSCVGTR